MLSKKGFEEWKCTLNEADQIVADYLWNAIGDERQRADTAEAQNKLRNGAIMSCGCWCHIAPGDRVGSVLECPEHGEVRAEKMNVLEPRRWLLWIRRSSGDYEPVDAA